VKKSQDQVTSKENPTKKKKKIKKSMSTPCKLFRKMEEEGAPPNSL